MLSCDLGVTVKLQSHFSLRDHEREWLERDFLREFLPRQRWFGGKGRQLRSTSVQDALWLYGCYLLLLVRAGFDEGPDEEYLVFLCWPCGEKPVDAVAEGVDESPALGLLQILQLFQFSNYIDTDRGRIVPHLASPIVIPREFAARIINQEQSNTSLVVNDQHVMKFIRRLQPGPNPDVEVGRFLLEKAHFRNVPALAGWLEYQREPTPPITFAILQSYIPSECTGWEQALRMLRLAQAGSDAPEFPARLLGQRTAELHRALASETEDPEFRPEPLATADVKSVVERICNHLELVRPALSELAATSVDARSLLEAESRLRRQIKDLDVGPSGQRIRVHGDYHLGQVLWTGEDYWIIDFEGEPTRPLAERRAKHSPLKDVAGMLRSFDYAAQSVLREAMLDLLAKPLMEWGAKQWQQAATGAFLQGYHHTARKADFLPPDESSFDALLNLLLLDKAVYELHYELNNRPDWAVIPLRGILDLLP